MNLENRAVTEYHGLADVSSMAIFKDRALLGNDSGIHEIDYAYTDDNGVEINAYGRFVASDLGLPNRKAVFAGQLSYWADGDLEINWQGDEVDESTGVIVQATDSNVYRSLTFEGDSEVLATYLEFAFANIDGCDFTLNTLSADFIVTHEGLAD